MFRVSSLRLVPRIKPTAIPTTARSLFSSFASRSVPQSRFYAGLAAGLALTLLSFNSLASPILNNAVLQHSLVLTPNNTLKIDGRFHLNYEELTIGSVTGMVLGIIIGKISSMLVFLGLSSYFLVQFLELRNIVTIPWTSIINVGKNRIDLRDLVLNNANFKIAFVSAFLIAAFNV